MTEFNGLGMNLGNLSRLSGAVSRSISAENPTGEKGKGAMAEPDEQSPARELGRGWKVRPCISLPAGGTTVLADIEGPGAVQSMWITGGGVQRCRRDLILRIYWEDQEAPGVEAPVGDFFAAAWDGYTQVTSLPVAANPQCALNCFWEMPFRRRCRITMENRNPKDANLYYQINYTLTDVPDDAAYFHAQFRRTNPLGYKEVYTIVDGIRGRGHYVGAAMAWGSNNNAWWGEGEIKFHIDGDEEFPTICGTGLEDYFGGSYGWEVDGRYVTYTTPYLGMHRVVATDGMSHSQQRFSMYRWHVMDPIRFESDLRVTIQALGWRSEGRFLPLRDDIASVAFWYQTLPAVPFGQLGDRDYLEII